MNAKDVKDRNFIATIGDEDTITGMILAGTGHINEKGKKNFLVVDKKTPRSEIESAFEDFTSRQDIAILIINQHAEPAKIAEQIRPTIEAYEAVFPACIEVPSKEVPFDPSKDTVLKRVKKLMGE